MQGAVYRSFRAMQRLCCAVRSTARPWCTSPAPHRADAHAFARRRRRLASRSVLDEDEVDRSRFNAPSRSVCCMPWPPQREAGRETILSDFSSGKLSGP